MGAFSSKIKSRIVFSSVVNLPNLTLVNVPIVPNGANELFRVYKIEIHNLGGSGVIPNLIQLDLGNAVYVLLEQFTVPSNAGATARLLENISQLSYNHQKTFYFPNGLVFDSDIKLALISNAATNNCGIRITGRYE